MRNSEESEHQHKDMRTSTALYKILLPVVTIGFTLHMGVIVLDLWRVNQNVNRLTYRELNNNFTAGMALMTDGPAKRNENFQFRWKEHVKKSCVELGFNISLDSLSREMLNNSRILVDDKHKILYCQIAKVASTTWRRIFIMLSEKVNITNPMSISANDAHHVYDKHLTYISDLPQDEVVHRIKTYFKFLFVREPFERLLSAFRNKFVVDTNASSYFKQRFGRKIIKRYRRGAPMTNNGSDVHFQEFVNYLIDSNRKIPLNEHWERFHDLCHPCQISYDFIGKLETFNEDSQYILEKSSLSTKLKIPSRSESKYAKTGANSYISQYYSLLSPDSLRQLYKTYMGDFLIFDYKIPDVIKYMM